MMHSDNVVVTIVDDNKKSLREYDFLKVNDRQKRCKVILPFDSCYKLLIKNQNQRRIKLEIEIDGTIVSGNGIIIPANQTDYIERFLSVEKKFKFVKPNSDGVADPTNIENGLVKVRVTKEKDAQLTLPPLVVKEEIHHYWPRRYFPYDQYNPYNPWWTNPTIYGGSFGGPLHTINDQPNLKGSAMNVNVESGTNFVGFNSVSPAETPVVGNADIVAGYATSSLGEVGATVEGSKSDQTFGTTIWNGDLGEASIFTFQLLGMKEEDTKEYNEYLKLKQKFEGT